MRLLLKLLPLILLLFLASTCAAFADDTMTVEQLQKVLECQRDAVIRVNVTNGQPLFDVKMSDKATDQLVSVKDEERRRLVQTLVASRVPVIIHDNLMDWIAYKFSGAKKDDMNFSDLAAILLAGDANKILRADIIDGSNKLDIQLADGVHRIVLPAELRQDLLDEMARKGIKLDHKAASLELGYILPGFVLGVLGLGLLYMFIPMKLASEVNPRPKVLGTGEVLEKTGLLENQKSELTEKTGLIENQKGGLPEKTELGERDDADQA